MSRHIRPLTKVLLAFCLFAFSIGGIAYFKQDLELQKQHRVNRLYQLYYLPSRKNLARLSLGYKGFLADMIWIRGLLYVGTHFAEGGTVKWLPKYTRSIYSLDPKFRKAYSWGAILMVYNRKKATREEELSSIRVLQDARKAFPKDYYFYYLLGMSYLNDIRIGHHNVKGITKDYKNFCKTKKVPKDLAGKLVPLIKATRRCLNRTAGAFLMEAASKANAPDHIALTAARLMQGAGSQNVLICEHLMDVLWRAGSKEVRDKVRMRMQRYCQRDVLDRILCKERAFAKRWRGHYNYISPSLFALMEMPAKLRGIQPMRFPAPLTSAEKCIRQYQMRLITAPAVIPTPASIGITRPASAPTTTSRPATLPR